jgi:hypothetical protein
VFVHDDDDGDESSTDPTGPFFSDFLALLTGSVSAALNKLVTQKTSTEALTSTTLTAVVSYDAALHNTLPGTWSATAGTFTCTVAGTYKVVSQGEFAANASTTTARVVYIQKALAASNTTFTTTRAGSGIPVSTSLAFTVPVEDLVPLAVGDVLRIAVQSNVALNLTNLQLDIRLA